MTFGRPGPLGTLKINTVTRCEELTREAEARQNREDRHGRAGPFGWEEWRGLDGVWGFPSRINPILVDEHDHLLPVSSKALPAFDAAGGLRLSKRSSTARCSHPDVFESFHEHWLPGGPEESQRRPWQGHVDGCDSSLRRFFPTCQVRVFRYGKRCYSDSCLPSTPLHSTPLPFLLTPGAQAAGRHGRPLGPIFRDPFWLRCCRTPLRAPPEMPSHVVPPIRLCDLI